MRRVLCLFLVAGFIPVAANASLNVSIAVFDPGIPGDASLHRDLQVFPKIREIESLFLPFVLRESLVRSGQWGAVRVIPDADSAAEVLVTGTIVRSDGGALEVAIHALDASGREWIDQTYTSIDGYRLLNDDIANDLLHFRSTLDDETVSAITEISLMRYARTLAPDAFDGYLDEMSDGTFRLLRLPAETDPMMERIHRIRGVEYVMTDAIDEKFKELHAEIESVYDVWREYRQWYYNFKADEAQRNALRSNSYESGSYEALRRAYDDYRMDRLAAQEQDKWIVGFDNEVGPAIERIEARVAELNGWVEDGYREWSRILGELFEIETGLD